jgi:hypothetical protein
MSLQVCKGHRRAASPKRHPKKGISCRRLRACSLWCESGTKRRHQKKRVRPELYAQASKTGKVLHSSEVAAVSFADLSCGPAYSWSPSSSPPARVPMPAELQQPMTAHRPLGAGRQPSRPIRGYLFGQDYCQLQNMISRSVEVDDIIRADPGARVAGNCSPQRVTG